MAAVLDHVRIESAVIGGESMGAGISLAFWRRHRQRVRALLLSRPAWLNASHPPSLEILRTMATLIDEVGREQALVRFADSAAFIQIKASYPETANSLMRILQDRTNLNFALVYKTIPASAPFEDFKELGGIDVPTVVLANRGDPLHPFDCASRLAAAIPYASVQEFPSKNESVDKHRQAFRRLVLEFISSLKAS